MKEEMIAGMSEKAAADGEEQGERTAEMVRREFFKRFGVYAAGSAAGLFVLMSAKNSRADGIGSEGAPPY